SGRSAVLPDREIGSAIVVEITNRRAAALAVNVQGALPGWDCVKTAVAIATEQKTAAGVIPACRRRDAKKVLGGKDVFAAVAIEVGHGEAKNRGELRFHREWPRFKMVAAIEEDHRIEGGCAHFAHRRQSSREKIVHAGSA